MNDYRCEVCGATFVAGSLLNAHIAEFHPPAVWKPVHPFEGQWTQRQTAEVINDALNRDNPLYAPNMLKKISELERRVAALEAENEQLKAGK